MGGEFICAKYWADGEMVLRAVRYRPYSRKHQRERMQDAGLLQICSCGSRRRVTLRRLYDRGHLSGVKGAKARFRIHDRCLGRVEYLSMELGSGSRSGGEPAGRIFFRNRRFRTRRVTGSREWSMGRSDLDNSVAAKAMGLHRRNIRCKPIALAATELSRSLLPMLHSRLPVTLRVRKRRFRKNILPAGSPPDLLPEPSSMDRYSTRPKHLS